MSTEDDDFVACQSCGYVLQDDDLSEEELDWFHQVGVWKCPNCGDPNGD